MKRKMILLHKQWIYNEPMSWVSMCTMYKHNKLHRPYSIPSFCAIGGQKICPYQGEKDESAWKNFVYALFLLLFYFLYFFVVTKHGLN